MTRLRSPDTTGNRHWFWLLSSQVFGLQLQTNECGEKGAEDSSPFASLGNGQLVTVRSLTETRVSLLGDTAQLSSPL